MRSKTSTSILAACAACAAAVALSSTSVAATGAKPAFSDPTRIDNPYLPLSKQRHWVLRGVVDGKRVRADKTLLDRTEAFQVGAQRVDAAIVQDRGYHNGILHEIALDYYAQATDGTVYYLGEDVNYYDKHGHVTGHHGAFRYGQDTEFLGIAMPAVPRPGQRYVTEDVPGEGKDRSRVLSAGKDVEVPAGRFGSSLEVLGFVLPDRESERKVYVRGVGLVVEEDPGGRLELTRVG
jgi:hypothetical protein